MSFHHVKGVAGLDFLTSCQNFFFGSFRPLYPPFPYMVHFDHVQIFFVGMSVHACSQLV